MEHRQLKIVPMGQNLHEFRREDDDWTGLTDPKERRRRQNRLHARAWRKRRAAREVEAPSQITSSTLEIRDKVLARSLPHTADAAWSNDGDSSSDHQSHRSHSRSLGTGSLSARFLHTSALHHGPLLSITDRSCFPKSSSGHAVRPVAVNTVPLLIHYMSASAAVISNLSVIFPLSPDHHLLALCQYNVLRATMTNLAILSLLDNIPIECAGARHFISLLPHPDSGSSLPASFHPTPLQQTVQHGYWIDAIPYPQLRDNLIRLDGTYDEDELCSDLCGGLYDGLDEMELRGMLVWSDPWCVDSWEVTEGFMKKWGFLLRGCESLIKSTNRWRLARGEEELVVEI